MVVKLDGIHYMDHPENEERAALIQYLRYRGNYYEEIPATWGLLTWCRYIGTKKVFSACLQKQINKNETNWQKQFSFCRKSRVTRKLLIIDKFPMSETSP